MDTKKADISCGGDDEDDDISGVSEAASPDLGADEPISSLGDPQNRPPIPRLILPLKRGPGRPRKESPGSKKKQRYGYACFGVRFLAWQGL